MVIFFNFSPTSNHLHPLQVENCDSNSRLVVNEDDNVKSGLKGFKQLNMSQIYDNHLHLGLDLTDNFKHNLIRLKITMYISEPKELTYYTGLENG